MAENMMLTTGSGFEGYTITEYLGIVSSQAILGSNFLKGLAANVADVSEKDTAKIEECRETAEQRLIKVAKKKGAQAIIGVHMHYAPFEAGSFGIICSGTAVKLEKNVVIGTLEADSMKAISNVNLSGLGSNSGLIKEVKTL